SRSGLRSVSRAVSSWVRLPEGGGLANEPAEPRVNDVELEEKASLAKLRVGYGESAGGEPARQAKTEAPDLEEVVRGSKDQRVLLLRMSFTENRCPSRIESGTGFFRDMRLDMNRQRHADAASDVFLEAGRAGE